MNKLVPCARLSSGIKRRWDYDNEFAIIQHFHLVTCFAPSNNLHLHLSREAFKQKDGSMQNKGHEPVDPPLETTEGNHQRYEQHLQ